MRGHRLIAAAGAAVLGTGLFSVASPAAAAGLDCTGYENTRTTRVDEGVTDTPWFYLVVTQHGPIEVCLDGPDGADFDVALVRFTENGQETVAARTGEGPDKKLWYNVTDDVLIYRVDVTATRGSGLYTVGLNLP